jgi:hypothetical protein
VQGVRQRAAEAGTDPAGRQIGQFLAWGGQESQSPVPTQVLAE